MNDGQIPRWLVESDPSWEKSVDSNLNVLKWTKKGTGGAISAVCQPTSMFCDLVGVEESKVAGLFDPRKAVENGVGKGRSIANSDLTKYLSSRYLNPQFGANISAFDPKRRPGLNRF